MKTINYLCLLLLIGILTACDFVHNPKDVAPTTPGNTNTVPRKIFLEDYTGQQCGNCPAAALKANQIKNLYGDNVVILAVHAGYFAEPSAIGTFTTDYRTTIGNDWDTFFAISAAGNPNGMINRKDFPTTTHIKNHNSWPTEASAYNGQAADAKLTIQPSYTSSTKILNVIVKTKFLNTLSANHKLCVVLMEDSIISPQKDYSQNPSTIYNYVQRHVLRGALNGAWGEALNIAPVAANDSVTKTISNVAINTAYNENKLYVIAFVYNTATYEVIQVEEKKIK